MADGRRHPGDVAGRPGQHGLFERAVGVIPGGVNSPVRAFGSVGGTPYFVERASGAYVTDADGNEYLDYVQSWGASILGHAHPDVLEAISEAAPRGTTFGAPTSPRCVWRRPSVKRPAATSSGSSHRARRPR